MDLASNRSGVGSDDITDETTSLVDVRWSSDEEESPDPQGQCLAAPQTPVSTYKQRFDEFRRLFKELQESERLIADYPCALQRDILFQGRLYLSENWLCFYSNVFRSTKITLSLKDISTMTREKTARLIPNAIQICTSTEKFFLTSFSAREKSYQSIFRMWQNILLDKPLTSLELWQMVKQHYGQDLGLSHENMESLQISAESSMQSRSAHSAVKCYNKIILGQKTSQKASRKVRHNLTAVESWSLFISRSCGLTFFSFSALFVSSVEERVGLSHVQGRLYLNKVFHMSANKMFELLFTDSSFIRRFMNVRKITNTSFTAWQKDALGNAKRSLNYTITISNPLIGKFSTVTENQTLYKESRDGHYYHVDSEVYTHDVPYHDYFYTQNRYYIISTSKRKSRLRVYTDVKYKKHPWGLVKSFITKNSWSGIEDYFRQLEAELLEEEAEMNQGGGDTGKVGGLRRRRRTYSRTLPEHMKQANKQYGQDPEQHRDNNMGT
uniref:GRAM domain containing 1c n=1 Tax=Mastacembelus armatus TaxID=205130 RepID=A0A7N9AMV7_9TELE